MLKEDLSKRNAEFEYINILDSLSNLKEFLRFRDNNDDVFKMYKENGKLGIPLVVLESEDGIKLITEVHKADFI